MKTKQMNRLTALFLSVILVFTGMGGYVKADNVPETTPQGSGIELPMEELDPSTLHVKKLEVPVEKEENFDDPDEIYGDDDMVRVSIVMERPSVMDAGYSIEDCSKVGSAANYRKIIQNNQNAVRKRIESKLNSSLDVKWNLSLTVNAISANVRFGDIEEIKQISGVKEVVLENRYESDANDPQTSISSSDMVGATDAWSAGYTGAGSRIAIIDTGIDETHQSFSADAFMHAIKELQEQDVSVELMTEADIPAGISGEGIYHNEKIPYAFNYVDGDNDVSHINDKQEDHGSHVAGIAAANRYVKQGGSYVSAAEDYYAVGMAPDAQLLIMKVFGKNGGAYDSDYMVAIEDAILLGADAINLSLGGAAPGFSYSVYYQSTLNKLAGAENLNAVVTISAGNSGAFTDALMTDLFIDDVSMHTGGSPGTYINSLGIASADNIGETGVPMLYGDKKVYFTETESTGEPLLSILGEWDFVYIDGIGEPEEYAAVNAAVSLEGKILITNRGQLSFYEKGNNAIPFEPKALLVANNEPGRIGMTLDKYTGEFPMISISYGDALYIKSTAESGTAGDYTYYTGKITVQDKLMAGVTGTREDASVSSFSSWGIPGSLIMKPELTAPGGNIYSVYGTYQSREGAIAGGPDQYVSYSGTSMAAPHVAGLAAVAAQYIRENPVSDKNEALAENYSTRAIIQSLLMSTATPMISNGSYVSVLQQGAGLADVSAALNASSVIMVGEEDDTLTALLGSAKDGKVKVEFGDDPYRVGEYTYSFTIHNTSDSDLEYELNTDLFTQAINTEVEYSDILGETGKELREGTFMDRATRRLASSADYVWEVKDTTPAGHDVDLDGDTDNDDAQAILDYITGEWGDQDIDAEAGDMDGDGATTTYDAHLLLVWIAEVSEYPDGMVKAHDSRTVTVTVRIDEKEKENLDKSYTSGAYVEGFTYATASGESEDGADLSHEHSIPLLGFYGNWSDPSMFDNTSLTDVLYGTYKFPYSGKPWTNYLTLTYNGKMSEFIGNPYALEEEFPEDRLAVNSASKFGSIYYNQIRTAGTTGFVMSLLDEEGSIIGILDSKVDAEEAVGLYYHVNEGAWQNTNTKAYSINKKVSEYGLEEGDVFRIGYYAIPEYYGMLLNEDVTGPYAGIIQGDYDLAILVFSEILGKGAYVGYDFTVDDTAPVIASAVLDPDTGIITIDASDNENLAYMAVMSLDGSEYYDEIAPATDEYTREVDAAYAIENANGYVAVFAADYAGNEAAVAVKVNDDVTVDPFTASEVVISPEVLDLYKGNTAELFAEVLPITAEDRTLVWSSDNEGVAVVDENGTVTAVGAGIAKISAASNTNERAYDEAIVYVTSVDKELNAVVWDEVGDVFFSSFNTNDLPNWTRLHQQSKALPLHSAFMYNDNMLISGTLNTSDATTDLYMVNRDSYELAEIGSNLYWANSIALGLTELSVSDLSGYFDMVYANGSALVAAPIIPLDDGSGQSYCGIAMTGADFSQVIGDNVFIAAVALVYEETDLAAYWFLDENGIIWETYLVYFEDEEWCYFTKPAKVMDTGIPTTFIYQSIYFDNDWLYWSHYDGSVAELMLLAPSIDYETYEYIPEEAVIYHAGDFGADVWPAAGLYVDGKVAPASVGDSTMMQRVRSIDKVMASAVSEDYFKETSARLAAEAKKTIASLTVSADEEELPETVEEELPEAVEEETVIAVDEAVEEITEAPETSAVETTEENTFDEIEETLSVESEETTPDEPVNVSVGGLNFISDRQAGQRVKKSIEAEQTVITDAGEEGEVEIEVSLEENKDSTNGLVIIDYDQDVLSYVKSGSELAYHSIHVDEEKGQIIFAYADLEPIAAHEELGEILFEAGCDDAEITVQTVESGDELDLKEEETIPVEGTGHEWEFEGFTWEGTESATADFVCKENAEHKQSIEADIIVLKTEPTTEADGSTTYKAVAVVDGETYTDTKVETIAKITYEITKGANGTWTGNAVTGDPYDLTVVRSYMDETTFSHFKELKMDGKVIDPADYTAKAGSLNISLAPEYLATLSEGQHDLSIVFDDAAVDTKLTIKLEDDSIPDTGVPGTAMPWMIVMTVSFMGIAAVLFFSGKRGFARNE